MTSNKQNTVACACCGEKYIEIFPERPELKQAFECSTFTDNNGTIIGCYGSYKWDMKLLKWKNQPKNINGNPICDSCVDRLVHDGEIILLDSEITL